MLSRSRSEVNAEPRAGGSGLPPPAVPVDGGGARRTERPRGTAPDRVNRLTGVADPRDCCDSCCVTALRLGAAVQTSPSLRGHDSRERRDLLVFSATRYGSVTERARRVLRGLTLDHRVVFVEEHVRDGSVPS